MIRLAAMIRSLLTICLCMYLITVAACRSQQNTSSVAISEPYLSDKYSLPFDIAPLPGNKDAREWLATYASHGKVAKFRFRIDASSAEDSKSAEGVVSVDFGKGAIIAEPGSDASVFLADLKKVLEAKHLPAKVQRTPSLPFTYAILGEHESQAVGGGFQPKPAGNWTAMKIFLGSENEDCEVFLNLNPVTGKAQFSEKDVDYGDAVLAKLATVL
jgi:hypothetical protein